MISAMVRDRILVHAVISADGSICGQSIVTRMTDGSFSINAYTGEISDTCFSNSIAVIAPIAESAQLLAIAAKMHTIPALISAIRAHLAFKTTPPTASVLHLVAPGV